MTTAVARTRVDEAREAMGEARAHLVDLERRLAEGDLSITAVDLVKAKGIAEHAELAYQGAIRAAELTEKGNRDRAGRALFRRWTKDITSSAATIDTAAEKAKEAMREVLAAIADYQKTRDRFHIQFQGVFPEATRGEPAALPFKNGPDFGRIKDGVRANPITHPGVLLASLLAEVLGEGRVAYMSPADREFAHKYGAPAVAEELQTIRRIASVNQPEETPE